MVSVTFGARKERRKTKRTSILSRLFLISQTPTLLFHEAAILNMDKLVAEDGFVD